jgi:SWIB/MDM2 domain
MYTQAVCAYIVRQKLQDAAQPGVVRCDARLRGVLGEAAVQVGSVAERLAPHLAPAPPIELTFSIKCACRLLLWVMQSIVRSSARAHVSASQL